MNKEMNKFEPNIELYIFKRDGFGISSVINTINVAAFWTEKGVKLITWWLKNYCLKFP